MTALSSHLNKDHTTEEVELDIASLGMTIATEDSVKQKKQTKRGSTKKGGRKSDSASSLGCSLSDLLEKGNDSGISDTSDPEEFTILTQDSREHSSSSLMKRTKRGGRKHQKHLDDDDDKMVQRSRTIQLEPDE